MSDIEDSKNHFTCPHCNGVFHLCVMVQGVCDECYNEILDEEFPDDDED